jgi:hypothetical protein
VLLLLSLLLLLRLLRLLLLRLLRLLLLCRLSLLLLRLLRLLPLLRLLLPLLLVALSSDGLYRGQHGDRRCCVCCRAGCGCEEVCNGTRSNCCGRVSSCPLPARLLGTLGRHLCSCTATAQDVACRQAQCGRAL